MPRIQGITTIAPNVLGAGLWIEPNASSLINYFGKNQAYITSITPVSPNASNVATFQSTLQSAIQSQIDTNHPQGAGAVTVTVIIKSISPLKWGVALT